MDQNIHDSKSHIGNSFFENLISGFWAYNIFIFVHTFQWTPSELFFSFQIIEKSPGQKRTSEKDHSFYKTVSLKKPHSFYKPQHTWQWNAPPTQPKTFLILQIFQHTCLCLVSEKTFALHHFLTRKSSILEALW